MRGEGKIKIELTEQEVDFLSDMLSDSISEYERIKSLNDAIGKNTNNAFSEDCERQRSLFMKLINGKKWKT